MQNPQTPTWTHHAVNSNSTSQFSPATESFACRLSSFLMQCRCSCISERSCRTCLDRESPNLWFLEKQLTLRVTPQSDSCSQLHADTLQPTHAPQARFWLLTCAHNVQVMSPTLNPMARSCRNYGPIHQGLAGKNLMQATIQNTRTRN